MLGLAQTQRILPRFGKSQDLALGWVGVTIYTTPITD
jgi:hypothetical protein